MSMPPQSSASVESSEASSSDSEPVVPLLRGRERRSNAGSKMRDLLHRAMDSADAEIFAEEVHDPDFEEKDEKDVFDSDFGSTSDSNDEGDDDDEAGERALQREEKESQKAARNKKKSAFVTPFAVRRPPRPPKKRTDSESSSRPSAPKKARVSEPGATSEDVSLRTSTRHSAVQFRQAVDQREKDDEQRRASLAAHLANLAAQKPKKRRELTQTELIDEALQTEELNKASLQAFYQAEEERKEQQTNLARWEVLGPKVRFWSMTDRKPASSDDHTSKVSEVTGTPNEPDMSPVVGPSQNTPNNITAENTPNYITSASQGSTSINSTIKPTDSHSAEEAVSTKPQVNGATTTSVPEQFPNGSFQNQVSSSTGDALQSRAREVPVNQTEEATTSAPYEGPVITEARNFLVIADYRGATKAQEMHALFGDHCEWGKAKAIPAKHRLVHRRQATCLITGLPAPYKDPLTGVPYANSAAFKAIRDTLNHAHIYSDQLGTFVGTADVHSYPQPPSPSPPPLQIDEEESTLENDEKVKAKPSKKKPSKPKKKPAPAPTKGKNTTSKSRSKR